MQDNLGGKMTQVRTRQDIENDLRKAIADYVTELNASTGMCVSEIDCRFIDSTKFAGKTEINLVRIDIDYKS